jgi:predicted GTPase
MPQGNQSDVARIRKQIEQEQQSAVWAMTAPQVGALKHSFISRRMERIGQLHDELKKCVGERKANDILMATMEAERPAENQHQP